VGVTEEARNRGGAEEFDFHEVDEGSIVALADLACGDDGPYYRQAWQLEKLLKRAGWQAVPEFHGTRRGWLVDTLTAHRHEPGELARFVRRLGDPREYHGEPPEVHQATVTRLNDILRLEGFQLRLRTGLPVILPATQEEDKPQAEDVELRVAITQLVDDPDKATLLERRFAEARTCRAAGAHLASVVMMGSALEGVLAEVVQQRGIALAQVPGTLQGLIDFCHTRGWVQSDAQRFSQELRQYRNLVHPRQDVRIGHFPDADTVTICWAVLAAALNDLADSAP